MSTHSVKYVVIVPIYAPFMLIAIIFHWEPLTSGKWVIRYKAKKTLHEILEDLPSMNVEDATPLSD